MTGGLIGLILSPTWFTFWFSTNSNSQTVALINLLVASNATPGTIIETKCGLAETEIQSKVESKSSFLFFSGGTSQSTWLSFGPKQLGCFLFTYFRHNQFYEVTKKLNPIYSLTYSASRLCWLISIFVICYQLSISEASKIHQILCVWSNLLTKIYLKDSLWS